MSLMSTTQNRFLLAAKILPVVKNQHLLLCTLLIGNSLAMEVCELSFIFRKKFMTFIYLQLTVYIFVPAVSSYILRQAGASLGCNSYFCYAHSHVWRGLL